MRVDALQVAAPLDQGGAKLVGATRPGREGHERGVTCVSIIGRAQHGLHRDAAGLHGQLLCCGVPPAADHHILSEATRDHHAVSGR